MLEKITNLLKANGQLLLHLSGRVKDKPYAEVEIVPMYKNKR
jgi:hypothetical protein